MSTIPIVTEQHIHTLNEKLDETEQWAIYLAWLRKRHSRLSTLKEDLAAAAL